MPYDYDAAIKKFAEIRDDHRATATELRNGGNTELADTFDETASGYESDITIIQQIKNKQTS